MKKQSYGIGIILFLLDQITKFFVIKHLPFEKSQVVLQNFFSLTYTKNTGGAFSILTGNTLFLSIVGIFIFIIVINFIEKNPPKKFLDALSIGCVIGGLLGNLFDRIGRGGVIDFLDFKIYSYNFPIFNIADIAIVLGIGIILVLEMRGEHHENRERKYSTRSIFK